MNEEEKNEKYKKHFADLFNMATLPFYWDALEPCEGEPRFEISAIGLNYSNRDELYRRIDTRVDIMISDGLVAETRALYEAGVFEVNSTAAQAIGYKEFLGVLDGTATVEQALEEVKLRSRQYAKRQLTWLRRNEAIHWIRWEKVPDFQSALQKVTEILTALGLS